MQTKKKPSSKDFPIYCFNIKITKDYVSLKIPIQMRFHVKKYKQVIKTLNYILNQHGYKESGGGCALDSHMYDICYSK